MGAFSDTLGGGGGSLLSSLRLPPAQPQQGLGDPDYSIGRAPTNSQFPEAASYERLQANKQQAEKVARAFTQLGVAVPENIRPLVEEGYTPEEPGFFSKAIGALAGNPVGGGILKAATVLGGVGRLVKGALAEVTIGAKDLKGYGNITLGDVPSILWGDPEKMQELTMRTGIDLVSGSQLLGMWGWGEADEDDWIGKTLRFVGHAGLEILSDPVSYASFAYGGIGRKAATKGADVAVRTTVREALEGTGDSAVHRAIRSRYDDMTEELYAAAAAGDEATLVKLFPKAKPNEVKDMIKAAEAGDYTAAEMFAEAVERKVVGESLENTPTLLSAGDLLTSYRDEIITPIMRKQFADIPEEWLPHLPAYARGGMRIVSPFAFTAKGQSRGFVIPGTRGLGSDIWDKTVRPITSRVREWRVPGGNSVTWKDVLDSVEKGIDYHKPLIKAVKDGKVTAGEYLLFEDAMQRAVIGPQLDLLTNQLDADSRLLLKDFDAWADETVEFAEEFPKGTGLSREAKVQQVERARQLQKGLFDFVTGGDDVLRIGGREVAEGSDFYQHAVRFREYAHNTMRIYNDEIKRLLGPEYGPGIDNYLPLTMGFEERAFLEALARKVPQVAVKMQAAGPQGGIDYFVGHLLNSVGQGGVHEVAIGSSAHLQARTFLNSPLVPMGAGTPLFMVEKGSFDDMFQALLDNVKPGEISATQFNDLVSGRLKELAAEHNVPLPKSTGTARVFTEDPFDLINSYAFSMETVLRQRNAMEALKEFGFMADVDTSIAVQKTLNAVVERLQAPAVQKAVTRISEAQNVLKQAAGDDDAYHKLLAALLDGKGEELRNVADKIRIDMSQPDADGWARGEWYDTPIFGDEAVEKYLGASHEDGVVVATHYWQTGGKALDEPTLDIFDPIYQLEKLKDAEKLDAPFPSMLHRMPPDQRPEWLSDIVWDSGGSRFQGGGGVYYVKAPSGEVKPFKFADEQDLQLQLGQIEGHFQTDDWKAWQTTQHRPRTVHAGTYEAAAQRRSDLSGGGRTLSGESKFREMRTKKGSRLSPVISDNMANTIGNTHNEVAERMSFGLLPKTEAGRRQGWQDAFNKQDTFKSFEEFYRYADYDVLRYDNGIEGAGLSYVIVNPDAIESSRIIERGVVGSYNPETRVFSQSVDPNDFDSFPIVYKGDGTWELQLGSKPSPGDAALIQRDFTRWMRSRGEGTGEYVITGVDQGGRKTLLAGDLNQVRRVADDTILTQSGIAFGMVERGLELSDAFAGELSLITRIARIARQKMPKYRTTFDPMDKARGKAFENVDTFAPRVYVHWDHKTKAVYYSESLAGNDVDDVLVATLRHKATRTSADDPYFLEFERNALKTRLSYDPDAVNKGILNQNDAANIVDDISWFAKRQGESKLIVDGRERIGDVTVHDLDQIANLTRMSDIEVYQWVRNTLASRSKEDVAARLSIIQTMRHDFGDEFMSIVTQTPSEILQAEGKSHEFLTTLDQLLRFGRDVSGDITEATTFMAAKGDPFEVLLRRAQKQAEALGINPNTFEPERTAVHNQTYEFVHPTTGETVKRNLVNPYLFGVGGPAVEGKVIAAELAEWFANVTANNATLYTPVGFGTFASNMRQVERWWKGSVTVTRPTFHIRNLVGGVWNNQIIGVGPQHYAQVAGGARRLRKFMEKNPEKTMWQAIQSLPPRQQRVFEAALQEGILGNSFMVSELKKMNNATTTSARRALTAVNPFSADNKLIEFGGTVMGDVESFLRMAAFTAWFDPDNPITSSVAREMSLAVHFDYKHLSKFETQVKRFVPFFVWTRRNIPLQLQVLTERPGLMTRYAHIMEAAEENFGSPDGQGADLPGSEYMTAFSADTGIVLNEGTPFWARLMLDPNIPPVDLFEAFDSLDPKDVLSYFSGQLNPIYSLPMDLMGQEDFGDVNAPAPMNVVLTQLARAGFYDVSQNGDVQIPYWQRTIYNALFPWAREYQDLAGGRGSNDPKRMQQLGIATEGDPDSQLTNALTALGLTLGKGIGLQAKTPRDTASLAFRGQEDLGRTIEEAFKNIPGFQEAYENS